MRNDLGLVLLLLHLEVLFIIIGIAVIKQEKNKKAVKIGQNFSVKKDIKKVRDFTVGQIKIY